MLGRTLCVKAHRGVCGSPILLLTRRAQKEPSDFNPSHLLCRISMLLLLVCASMEKDGFSPTVPRRFFSSDPPDGLMAKSLVTRPLLVSAVTRKLAPGGSVSVILPFELRNEWSPWASAPAKIIFFTFRPLVCRVESHQTLQVAHSKARPRVRSA